MRKGAKLFLTMLVVSYLGTMGFAQDGKAAEKCARIDYVENDRWGYQLNVETREYEVLTKPQNLEYLTEAPVRQVFFQITASSGAIVTYGASEKKLEETTPDGTDENGEDVYRFLIPTKIAKNGGKQIVKAKLGTVETQLEVEFKTTAATPVKLVFNYKASLDLSDPKCEYGKIVLKDNGEELKRFYVSTHDGESDLFVSDTTEKYYYNQKENTLKSYIMTLQEYLSECINYRNNENLGILGNEKSIIKLHSSNDKEFMEMYEALPEYPGLPDESSKRDYFIRESFEKTTPEMWNKFMKPLVRKGSTVYCGDFMYSWETLTTKYASKYEVTDTKWTVNTRAVPVSVKFKGGKLKIAKQKTAPKIKVDAVNGTISTTGKMEYQYKLSEEEDSTYSEWTSSTTKMKLSDITSAAILASGVSIRVRTAKTQKVIPSAYTTVIIPSRASIDMDKITISGSVTNAALKATDADNTKKPYEYTTEIPSDTTKWKSLTSNGVTFKGKTALSDGSKVYVREKGVNANEKKQISIKMPSTILEITASGTAVEWVKKAYLA